MFLVNGFPATFHTKVGTGIPGSLARVRLHRQAETAQPGRQGRKGASEHRCRLRGVSVACQPPLLMGGPVDPPGAEAAAGVLPRNMGPRVPLTHTPFLFVLFAPCDFKASLRTRLYLETCGVRS